MLHDRSTAYTETLHCRMLKAKMQTVVDGYNMFESKLYQYEVTDISISLNT